MLLSSFASKRSEELSFQEDNRFQKYYYQKIKKYMVRQKRFNKIIFQQEIFHETTFFLFCFAIFFKIINKYSGGIFKKN